MQESNKQSTTETKTFEKMYDSEFLAYILAQLIKDNNVQVSDYTFKRVDKILQDLAKQEMI